MNSQKKVNEKLFSKTNKTELAAQKIELALVDDFEKKFKSLIDDSTSIGSQLIDALSKAENKYKVVKSDAMALVKVGQDLEQKAKDLGIDLPATVKNKFKSVEVEIKEANNLISKISQLYSAF